MRLRPSKHSHPDRTVVGLSVVLLRRLQSQRLVDYTSLRDLAKKSVHGGDFLFLPAINMLFLLGLLEYRPKTDSFEYLGRHEAV